MAWEEPEQFWRQALSKLNTWKRGDQRAVHKPLLTLMLIAKAASNGSRRIHFVTIVEELAKLLQEFGPRRRSYHPEFPFWYLQTDGFWEVENRSNLSLKKSSQSPTKQTLLAQDAVGAVPQHLWEALQRNAALRTELAQQILDEFWPPTMHDAIRQAIGLPGVAAHTVGAVLRGIRTPRFREEVLRAYERRCAICGYDGRLGDTPLGLEAAHIKWYAWHGPDQVDNGLALCAFHHLALDAGALGLSDELHILVSCDVNGQTMLEEFIHRSQDVIARHARLEWYPVAAAPIDPAWLNPAQWSRRRPASTGDMKSVAYLCCPAQRAEGWAYLAAVATFFRGDWNGDRTHYLVPARQLDFQDPKTSQIFEETHNLGTWVVNYDELLDRRQLLEQQVRIIRYKQVATQGRNLIVSSRAPTGLLGSMLVSRLRDLNLNLDNSELDRLADRFIADANDLSGDIILRAAKSGRSASELMGLVLSRYVVRHEVGPERYAGWYFLDDYADWLGQREEQIADLMALCPITTANGAMSLMAVITEAKYIVAAALAAKRKESQKQLRDTLRRVAGAVGGEPVRLDRDIWLARLSDLLVDGVRFPIGANLDLPAWRRAIREDRCTIDLRGYSHVFVSGPVDAPDCSELVRIPNVGDASYSAVQEIFGRDRVRELVLRYYRGEDPTAVRGDNDGGLGGGGLPNTVGSVPTASAPRDRASVREYRERTPTNPTGDLKSSDEADELDAAPAGPAAADGERVSPPDGDASRRHWLNPAVAAWAHGGGIHVEDDAEALAWLQQVESTTKLALQQFQLQAKLLHSVLTPNAALLKFQGSANLTVDQVLRRRTEFLTTYGLNLIGVQPEPGAVSLSVARPRRQIVPLGALWQRWTPGITGDNQDVLIGVREDDGELLVLSPGHDHAPHTLIAGSTGSGKSVLMQNIILSIVATNRPDQARITLVDPKQGVDYFAFEGLPHLDGGIIDQQEEALARIQRLVDEMDARYVRMRHARAANLRQHNERVGPAERLPMLWLIHDEFADWMLAEEYKQEVASAVQRLGIRSRAAGIHLVFAAQRPEVNVMPMQLRANLGNRLILRVDSEGTSEIALGEKGAERLLGRGHLLAKLEGTPSLVYAQVPFATPEEIDEVVQLIRSGTE